MAAQPSAPLEAKGHVCYVGSVSSWDGSLLRPQCQYSFFHSFTPTRGMRQSNSVPIDCSFTLTSGHRRLATYTSGYRTGSGRKVALGGMTATDPSRTLGI